MKRIIFILVNLIFSMGFLIAQSTANSNKSLSIGWSVGYNHSNIINEDGVNTPYQYMGGVNGGLYLKFQSLSPMFIIGDIFFDQKGYRYSNVLDYDMKLDYVSTGITIGHAWGAFNLNTGVYYSWLGNVRPSYDSDMVIIGGSLQPDEFNNHEIGWKFGVGADFLRGFAIELSYQRSFNSIYDFPISAPSGGDTGETLWYKNRYFSLKLRAKLASFPIKN